MTVIEIRSHELVVIADGDHSRGDCRCGWRGFLYDHEKRWRDHYVQAQSETRSRALLDQISRQVLGLAP